MKFAAGKMEQIAEENNMAPQTFKKNYVVAREKKSGICIFQATYAPTDQSRFPDDGKLRDIKPDLSWLTVGGQHILPNPGVWKRPPIPLNVIYS